MYTAVVLDSHSSGKLKDWALTRFPSLKKTEWKLICHHMTIQFGEPLPEHLKGSLGTNQVLQVTHVAYDQMVVAVRVKGYWSRNAIPHVTVAVNPTNGGRPVMSNQLTNWEPVFLPFELRGVVQEEQ